MIRAMLSNPKIVILDEATSDVDSLTEKNIESSINELTKGKTSIIIAHRLSTIISADKIIVIDNGNAIKFKNKYYQPYIDDELKCFLPKTKCLIIETFDGNLFVTIDENIYNLKKLERNQRFSKEFDQEDNNKIKEKKIYRPPMSHPFKLQSFLRQMEKSHKQHQYA